LRYAVRFSAHAKEDKIEIREYLSNFYPATPKRFTKALKNHISGLKENPYMYPVYPENPDYRCMGVDNYIVFYKIIEAVKEITVLRILRASWDLPKYL